MSVVALIENGPDGGEDLHAIRHDRVEILDRGVVYFLGARPGIGLEVLPGLNGAAALVLPVTHSALPVRDGGGVGEGEAAAGKVEAGDHRHVVVAHLVAEAEVQVDGLEGFPQLIAREI
jgi:hypothetical protein